MGVQRDAAFTVDVQLDSQYMTDRSVIIVYRIVMCVNPYEA